MILRVLTVQLDPRFIALQRASRWITVAILGLLSMPLVVVQVLATAHRGFPGFWPSIAWMSAVGLLGWWAHAWPPVVFRHASYELAPDGIEIRRGVFWRFVTNVPRSRVQHTDVSQGPLERHFGLGTLVIYTAGTDAASVDLPGLAHERALELRDRLLPGATDDAV
jgi:membrane protein YdbS with pleckstrin-like domain